MADVYGADNPGGEALAQRARDIAERANRLLADAEEAARAGEELSDIEDKLAALEREQRRLDEEFLAAGAGERVVGAGDGEGDVFAVEAAAPLAGPVGDERRAEEEEGISEEGERSRRPVRGLAGWVEDLTSAVTDTITETLHSHLGSIGGLGASVADAVSGFVMDSTRRVSEVIEREIDTGGPVSVTVDNFAGGVSVTAGPDGKVGVRAEVFQNLGLDSDPVRLFVDQDGDRVFIRCQSPHSGGGRHHAKLTVTVPRGTGLDVRTQGGAVSVDGVGALATVRTAGGGVQVSGASGDVDAGTAGGGVTVDGQTGGRVRAVTMGGQVTVRGNNFGPVEAQTSGGSIRIDGVSGPVRAHTAGGSVTVSGRVSGDWSLRTAGGSVTAIVPSSTDALVDGSGGSASTDFTELESDRRRLRGRLGDGSAGTITLRSMAGKVALFRAPAPEG